MKRIINGKRYDTKTAEAILDIGSNGYSTSDFKYNDTWLYRTKNGRWFIAGNGGPMSRWAHQVGNGYSGGSGLEALTADEARELLEEYNERRGATAALEQYFPVEDA